MGGGAVTQHLAQKFKHVYASDIHEDLMLMWQAVQDGWVPPTELSEAQWRELKDAEPSALRGFAGFGCSFGGRWFEGFARSRGRNHPAESSRNIMRFEPHMGNVEFAHRSYMDIAPYPGDVVYCDPPYEATKPYSMGFDHETFWAWAEDLAKQGVHVYVSEYNAPEGWTCVWEKEQRIQVDANKNNKQKRLEKLWTM